MWSPIARPFRLRVYQSLHIDIHISVAPVGRMGVETKRFKLGPVATVLVDGVFQVCTIGAS
jgi:hypothetical protein